MEEGTEPAGLSLLLEKASNGDGPEDVPKPTAGLAARAAKPPPDDEADPNIGTEA
jgi:hypothetical protein